MRWELLYPSKYLKAIDLDGRDVPLEIESVSREELQMGGGKVDEKPVVSFRGTKKQLVLAKTNARTIAVLHGLDVESWVGKRITLCQTRVRFGPKMVDAIRVKCSREEANAAQQARDMETREAIAPLVSQIEFIG